MNLPDLCLAKDRRKGPIKYIDLDLDIKKVFQGQKYFLRTYGCQMNFHDSEEIRYYLEALGYEQTTKLEAADIIVLNTCAVRENAKDKVLGYLGRCKHLKKNKPNLIICVCGCLMQLPNEVENIRSKHSYIDIVVGTHNISDLPKLILEKKQDQVIEVYSNSDKVYENVKYLRDSKITAWLNITYGCDKFCTYCIVPFTRGKERSRKMANILEEVNDLKANGYQEVMLLGQNVNAYGKDLNLGYDFATLLEKVAQTGIPRIRFMTPHPWNFTDEMIDVISKYNNIMPHVHLPLQSGSDEILKKMNRHYTASDYKNLVAKLKSKIKNVAITTDIIVGFPNETDFDFQKTLDMVKYCKYDGAYTFIYSPREKTVAAQIEDKTPLEVKEKRLQTLNKLVNKYSLENNQKYLNQVVEVLIIGSSPKDSTKVQGYTDTFKLVNIKAPLNTIGKIIKAKIIAAKSFSLDGVIYKEEKCEHLKK